MGRYRNDGDNFTARRLDETRPARREKRVKMTRVDEMTQRYRNMKHAQSNCENIQHFMLMNFADHVAKCRPVINGYY